MRKSLYMKILVPLDGSEYSEKALLHACDIGKNYHANLLLLYVIEKSLPINLLDRKEYLEILRKFGNKVLIKGKEITTNSGIDSKIILKEGNITNEIIKLAKNEKCNLIIVGNKGLGATTRFFLGSVSNKLANNSPCSILIVK
jgi:nucleotide-binding universal stress UspA family protein